MSIAELIKSFAETSRERIKTPITGSFMLTFILYNWRPLVLLMFSNSSIEERIATINAEYCTIWSILIPLLIAALYVAGVPYLMMVLEKASGYALTNRKRYKSIQKVEDLKLLEEVLKLELNNERIRSGKEDIKELNNKVEDLNSKLSEKTQAYDLLNDIYKSTLAENLEETRKNQELFESMSKRTRALEAQHNVLLSYSGLHEAVKIMSSNSLSKFMNLQKSAKGGIFVVQNRDDNFIRELVTLKLINISGKNAEITNLGNRLAGYVNSTASVVFENQSLAG